MATFNGTYENAYAQQLMGEFFRNSLRYFKGEVRDSEYFKPVMSMLDERGIEQRIYDRFGGEALVKCGVARTCEEAGRGPHNGRQYGAPAMFYGHDDPVDTLQELWTRKRVQGSSCSLPNGITTPPPLPAISSEKVFAHLRLHNRQSERWGQCTQHPCSLHP